ncbi:MAG: FecR domain-containing protein [Pseudomonadota bacterium]
MMKNVQSDNESLFREAARLVIRLNENPGDPQTLSDRDVFLARGDAERDAFARTVRTVKIARKRSPKRATIITIFMLFSACAISLGLEPLRVILSADWRTERDAGEFILASGDNAFLDASSAIGDQTGGESRRVVLLQGAGFFDVEPSHSSFRVEAGPLIATAIGTSFEVSIMGDDVLVSVSEGLVEVETIEMDWMLKAGDRLIWSDAKGGLIDSIPIQDIAGWRMDRITTNGMTFAQVVEVIDRRLPGTIIIAEKGLAHSEMAGALDLTRPKVALELALSARQARQLSLPRLITVIGRKK